MAGHPVKVFVFVSEHTRKLPLDEVKKLIAHRDKVQLIEMAGTGHNALDFHIAYYAGRIAAADPDAYIHIIFKDTGFDPLIAHLRGQKVLAGRSGSVDEIEILHAPGVSELSLEDRGRASGRTSTSHTAKSSAETVKERFSPLESLRRALDLDDGVKTNYLKFPGLLAKIPGFDKKEEE